MKLSHKSPTNDGLLIYEFVVSEVSKGKTGTFPPKGSNAVLPNNQTLDDEIENLKVVEGVNDITFTWKNPSVSEFSGVKIFNGNSLVATLKKGDISYKVDGLKENTNYNFKFVSMLGDRLSLGIEKEVKTKPKPKEPMPLVKPPENVFLTPQDKKMVIAWDDVKSPYLEGYNVYIDGKKINDKPLTSNKLIVRNLENEKSYKVQISAVNKENVEGEKSKEKTEKPSSSALEVEYDVKMPFNPKDVVG
ncbi:fibronectin type III domain-containing protein, partial [Bacillus thuringiensis]|nr:fibronectin type III domain-containing protein [Bacillus thuringiensis]